MRWKKRRNRRLLSANKLESKQFMSASRTTLECQKRSSSNNCSNEEGLFRGFRSRSVIGLFRRFGRTYCLPPCGDWIWFGWMFKWLWGRKYVGYMGWLESNWPINAGQTGTTGVVCRHVPSNCHSQPNHFLPLSHFNIHKIEFCRLNMDVSTFLRIV